MRWLRMKFIKKKELKINKKKMRLGEDEFPNGGGERWEEFQMN